jgi:quercetin dioxygenase-like cupin family protein/CDGSH-type Zn-finger protein
MDERVIAARKPCLISVEQGKTYFWCRCGRSENQPFCDGAHKGTEITPLKWTAEKTGDQLLCACKHTRAQPFCDGSHNNLSATYAAAEAGDGEHAVLVDYAEAEDGSSRAMLDNGCYVIRVPESAMERRGSLRIFPVIGARDGAKHLSQYFAVVEPGDCPVQRYPGVDVTLFVVSGRGHLQIADRWFELAPGTGACVKPGEGFRLSSDGGEPMVVNISVCPQCEQPEYLDKMPSEFDASVPERAQPVDEEKREAMADRFFQVLVDEEQHGTPVTLFIGEIPKSRAAHHRHLYEETITILSGEGYLWTDETKTPVRVGDTIFLPRKQHHSLECTDPSGMRLVGVFYPSMSPAINY